MRLILWAAAIAVVDLIVLSRVGVRLGGGKVLLYLAAAAIVGILAIRTRGFRGRRVAGASPDLLDAALAVVAGLLLIFPGPLSDVLGFLLLIPSVRAGIGEKIRASLSRWTVPWMKGAAGPPGGPAAPAGGFPGADQARDVEFEEVDPPGDPPRPSPSSSGPAFHHK